MKIEVLLVANGAGIENGLLNVHGGGWEYTSPPFFPSTIRGAVCGIAILDESELGTTPIVTFSIVDKSGSELGWRASTTIDGVRRPPAPGVLIRVPFMAIMSAVVTEPTIATITMSKDDVVIETTAFEVRDVIPNFAPNA